MSDNNREVIYRFGRESIVDTEGLSPEQVRQQWSQVHASLANAEIVRLGDNQYEFRTVGGDKGC